MASGCRSCGEGPIVTDPDSGDQVCGSCGVIASSSSDNFVAQIFDSTGAPLLHYVNPSRSYHDRKIFHAETLISDLTSRLGLSASRSADVLRLVSDVTSGSLGSGDWFPVLVAAASYIVTRRHRLPLSLSEAAAAAGGGCDAYELGRMVARVQSHLDLKELPPLDPIQLLDRSIRSCPSFAGLDRRKMDDLTGQGRFLMQCAMKWALLTGRQPLPMVAAVIAFVAEVNGINNAKVETIATEIYAGVRTSRLRLKELIETLVKVATKLLPWGEDVNAKNLVKNAPVLIKMMEMKAKAKGKNLDSDRFGFDFKELLSEYSDTGAADAKYFKVGERSELEDVMLSRELRNAVDQVALAEKVDACGKGDEFGRKRKRGGLEFDMLNNSLEEGRWDLDKNLSLEEVMERDVGYDTLPVSFVNGVEARARRRVKIEAAKRRISEAMGQLLTSKSELGVEGEDSREKGRKEDPCFLKLCNDRKRRRGIRLDDVDQEDCVIELLLLHRVNEEEIEQGHYNRLLDLHVFAATDA